jgi:hypothetical protein
MGNARTLALDLMREFDEIGRLDIGISSENADPKLSLRHLFPEGRGQMFGVLECRDRAGETRVLRAFSSLHEGTREVDGWAPPVLDAETFDSLLFPGQLRIKRLTRDIRAAPVGSPERGRLRDERREFSRTLMSLVHDRYRLRNFRGERRPLREVFNDPENGPGIPGGTGECCAPKLLNHAAELGLSPVGLAEFYWGGASAAKEKVARRFYPPCATRCRPILGYMLCGLDDAR